jgi:hypothetical protein
VAVTFLDARERAHPVVEMACGVALAFVLDAVIEQFRKASFSANF